MKMCNEAREICDKIKHGDVLGVLAELISDESHDMQKYVWLSDMVEDQELKELLLAI